MAKVFVDLTELAERAGLKLTVSISRDLSEPHSFNNGDAEEFDNVGEAYRWLDGYVRGRATSRPSAGSEGATLRGSVNGPRVAAPPGTT